jgi:hypothetical protein
MSAGPSRLTKARASSNGVHPSQVNNRSPSADGPDPEPDGPAAAVAAKPKRMGDAFPQPIPASQLRLADAVTQWVLHGYLTCDGITLLSAIWKAGKTTWLAHLLRAIQAGEMFCGQSVRAGRVLYVTEESESIWATRRDKLGLTDATDFVVRPFIGKPTKARWNSFVTDYLPSVLAARPADLVVLDTLGNLWPVKDENNAAEVQEALMPLRLTSAGRALLLVHHLSKGDASEGKGSRGSGALMAFVDVLVEFRRFKADDRTDRRRVMSAWGRYDETPAELVVELTEHGYQEQGDRETAANAEIVAKVLSLLPSVPPGITIDEIAGEWPEDQNPRRDRLLNVLRAGAIPDGGGRQLWTRNGSGKRGDPYLFLRVNK